MSEITLTDGTKIIFNLQCDCGLTGGCEKCQPFIYTPKMQKEDIEMAEMGMEDYARQLEKEDND